MVMSSIALTAGIISSAMGVIMLIVGIRLFIQYLKKKNIAGLFLCLSVFGFTFTVWCSVITYLIAGIDPNAAVIFQKLIYVFVFLGTMFTYLFASRIFFEPKKIYSAIYLIIGVVAIFLIALTNSSDTDVFPDGSNYPLYTLNITYSIVLVLFIIPTALGVFWVAWRLSNKVDNKRDRKRFRLIAIGQLMIPVTFIIDTLSSVFITILFLYALFLYLTWVPPAIAAICYDLGWIVEEKKIKTENIIQR